MIAPRSTIGDQWLGPDFEFIEAVARTGNGLVDLWEASPVRLDSNEPKTEEIIDSLFLAILSYAAVGLVIISTRASEYAGTSYTICSSSCRIQ